MNNTDKKFRKMMLLVVIAIITVCGLTGCTKQEFTPVIAEAPTAIPTMMIIAEPTPIHETPPASVTVEMESLSLTYSGLYAEMVICTELTDTVELDFEFAIPINETVYTLFKVVVGTEDGDIVSMLNGPDGVMTPVSFYMNMLPEGMEGDDASTFYIAQDVVNEVIDTLTLL